ncbi:hypothetical protein Tco_0299584, partial [Tanacetum coccineum]
YRSKTILGLQDSLDFSNLLQLTATTTTTTRLKAKGIVFHDQEEQAPVSPQIVCETRTDESSKRSGDELESDKSKKQKIDEHVDAEKDDDLEEEEMKKHMEIVQDKKEVAIDAIPLATKPPVIVEYKIGIDREDLETLWKLVKVKHGLRRPEEDYERVLWGDLRVMVEPGIKSEVWRSLQ